MSYPDRSPLGRWSPLSSDDHMVGRPCDICDRPMKVGQVPSFVNGIPVGPDEWAKAISGRAHTTVAQVAHESCAWPDPR